MVPSTREATGNEDICAVLHLLMTAETVDIPCGMPCANSDGASIAAFLLDHAHHADRLPQLLRELSAA